MAPFTRVDRWCAAVPEAAWATIEVRDGEQGPIVVQVATALVQARAEGRVADVAERLVVFRERQADGSCKHDYLLSDAVIGTAMPMLSKWVCTATGRANSSAASQSAS